MTGLRVVSTDQQRRQFLWKWDRRALRLSSHRTLQRRWTTASENLEGLPERRSYCVVVAYPLFLSQHHFSRRPICPRTCFELQKDRETLPHNWQSDDDESSLLYGGRGQFCTVLGTACVIGKVNFPEQNTQEYFVLVWRQQRTHLLSSFPKIETLVKCFQQNDAFTAASKHLNMSNLHNKTTKKKNVYISLYIKLNAFTTKMVQKLMKIKY